MLRWSGICWDDLVETGLKEKWISGRKTVPGVLGAVVDCAHCNVMLTRSLLVSASAMRAAGANSIHVRHDYASDEERVRWSNSEYVGGPARTSTWMGKLSQIRLRVHCHSAACIVTTHPPAA